MGRFKAVNGASLVCSALLMMTACDKDETSYFTENEPTIVDVSVSGSNGDMAKYVDVWVSECGISLSNLSSGVRNVYKLDSVSGNTVSGTVEVTTYSDIQCAGEPLYLYPDTYSVVITYVQTVSVDSESSGYHYIGTADELLFQYSSQPQTTSYVGFMSEFSEFKLSPTNDFSPYDMTYN